MNFNKLTPEQQKEIRKLVKSSAVRIGAKSLKLFLILMAANIFVITLDQIYVHNLYFVLGSALFTAMMLSGPMQKFDKEERERLALEIKKVLDK